MDTRRRLSKCHSNLPPFFRNKSVPFFLRPLFSSFFLGVGVTRHRSHCPRRIEVLLLISALANYIICLTGLQAREAGHERRFQSNSLKRRRVLSLWRLGLDTGVADAAQTLEIGRAHV